MTIKPYSITKTVLQYKDLLFQPVVKNTSMNTFQALHLSQQFNIYDTNIKLFAKSFVCNDLGDSTNLNLMLFHAKNKRLITNPDFGYYLDSNIIFRSKANVYSSSFLYIFWKSYFYDVPLHHQLYHISCISPSFHLIATDTTIIKYFDLIKKIH
jgi:hypothetical protein